MKFYPQLSILTFLALTVALTANPSLDLSGEWRFALDKNDEIIGARSETWGFPDRIQLPGTVTSQGFGEVPSMRTKWTAKSSWRYPEMFKEWQADDNFKMPFFLLPPRHYVGPAWYQREIGIGVSVQILT